MYTTINPSVTITPVYNTTKEKQKHPLKHPAVSAVTVQVEPVDLSTRPAHQAGQESSLWAFLTAHTRHSCKSVGGDTEVEGAGVEDMVREKEEKTSEWSKSKKIHRCSHPGCEKVRQRINQNNLPTYYSGLYQELTP